MITFDLKSTLNLITTPPEDILAAAAQRAATLLRKRIVAQFASSGTFGGSPWAPLLKTGEPSHLIASGRLYQSLADPRSAEAIDEPGPRPGSYRIGTTVPYAAFHQAGTRTLRQRQIITPLMLIDLGGIIPIFRATNSIAGLTTTLEL